MPAKNVAGAPAKTGGAVPTEPPGMARVGSPSSVEAPPRASVGAAFAGAEVLRFGVPSGRRVGPEALEFLNSCGLRVRQQSERQLTATLRGLPGVVVALQRTSDIVRLVADGVLDIGMAGQDFVQEHAPE